MLDMCRKVETAANREQAETLSANDSPPASCVIFQHRPPDCGRYS